MRSSVFIGFRQGFFAEDTPLKKIKFEGKEYVGLMAEKPFLTLTDIEKLMNTLPVDSHQVTLLPVLLFG